MQDDSQNAVEEPYLPAKTIERCVLCSNSKCAIEYYNILAIIKMLYGIWARFNICSLQQTLQYRLLSNEPQFWVIISLNPIALKSDPLDDGCPGLEAFLSYKMKWILLLAFKTLEVTNT